MSKKRGRPTKASNPGWNILKRGKKQPSNPTQSNKNNTSNTNTTLTTPEHNNMECKIEGVDDIDNVMNEDVQTDNDNNAYVNLQSLLTANDWENNE